MSIGVVIPTYNRRNNLVYTLQSLAWQSRQDFHVVVADDGSTDGTRQLIEQLSHQAPWQDRLRWVGCGPNLGAGRQGRARNIGAANLPQECTLLITVDSDVILNPDGIDLYAQTHAQYPSAVILGVIDWLPPLAFSELAQILQDGGVQALRRKVPTTPRQIEGTIVGSEIRDEIFHNKVFQAPFDPLHPLRPTPPGAGFSGNVGYPLQVFRDLGGFDEAMIGYGYEDTDLDVRVHKKGIPCLLHAGIWALHIWHAKGDPGKSNLEKQRNIDYLLRKHGLSDEGLEAVREWASLQERLSCDWSYWGHYHRLRGGHIVSVDHELWAINSKGTHRIALPSPDWLKRLGFVAVDEVKAVEAADLAHILLGTLSIGVLPAGSALYPCPDLSQQQTNGLMSPNGVFQLVLQPNGELVLFMVEDAHATVLWSSHTAEGAVQGCFMQPDGNLVLSAKDGSTLWSSGTAQHPGAHLEVQDDGNLVIYDASHRPLWATNAHSGQVPL